MGKANIVKFLEGRLDFITNEDLDDLFEDSIDFKKIKYLNLSKHPYLNYKNQYHTDFVVIKESNYNNLFLIVDKKSRIIFISKKDFLWSYLYNKIELKKEISGYKIMDLNFVYKEELEYILNLQNEFISKHEKDIIEIAKDYIQKNYYNDSIKSEIQDMVLNSYIKDISIPRVEVDIIGKLYASKFRSVCSILNQFKTNNEISDYLFDYLFHYLNERSDFKSDLLKDFKSSLKNKHCIDCQCVEYYKYFKAVQEYNNIINELKNDTENIKSKYIYKALKKGGKTIVINENKYINKFNIKSECNFVGNYSDNIYVRDIEVIKFRNKILFDNKEFEKNIQ